jgi:hypothetical protein
MALTPEVTDCHRSRADGVPSTAAGRSLPTVEHVVRRVQEIRLRPSSVWATIACRQRWNDCILVIRRACAPSQEDSRPLPDDRDLLHEWIGEGERTPYRRLTEPYFWWRNHLRASCVLLTVRHQTAMLSYVACRMYVHPASGLLRDDPDAFRAAFNDVWDLKPVIQVV